MTIKKTLQSFLSSDLLRKLAGPKVYARGEEYYGRDCVEIIHHLPNQALAEVMGAHPYRVELKLAGKKLEAYCTCPAMTDFGFCKHAVATGLFLIDAPPSSNRKNKEVHVAEVDEFGKKYPSIAGWIKDGWIEIGRGEYTTSMIRVLDEGGLVWEGGTRHKSIDKMLKEAEQAIINWDENL